MTIARGITISSLLPYSVYHKSRSPKGNFVKVPGRLVGVISIQPKDFKPGDYNPYILHFTVSPFRKDLNKVIDQANKTSNLPAYEQSLFDSCFKHW